MRPAAVCTSDETETGGGEGARSRCWLDSCSRIAKSETTNSRTCQDNLQEWTFYYECRQRAGAFLHAAPVGTRPSHRHPLAEGERPTGNERLI